MKQLFSQNDFLRPTFPARLHAESLPEWLASRQIGCVLLLTDAPVSAQALLSLLDEQHIMYTVQEIDPAAPLTEPSSATVETALQFFADKQAQAIVALGGSSAVLTGQALLARLHSRQFAERFDAWNQIPLLLLPVGDVCGAAIADQVVIWNEQKQRLQTRSLRRHQNRVVVTLPSLLNDQTREMLLESGVWTAWHAISAAMSPFCRKEAWQKAVHALQQLHRHLLSAADEALKPLPERVLTDLDSRLALEQASLDAAEAFAVTHRDPLSSLLRVLQAEKQFSPSKALFFLLPTLLTQLSGHAHRQVAQLTREAGYSVAAEDAAAIAALTDWLQALTQHAQAPEMHPALSMRDIPALAQQAARPSGANRFALERLLWCSFPEKTVQKEISSLFAMQQQYFAAQQTHPVQQRLDDLHRLHLAIDAHEKDICAALESDLGKCAVEGYMCEIGMVLSELGWMQRHLRQLCRPTPVHTPLAQFPSRSFICHDPYGTVLILSPWNYPFLLTMQPLIGALSGGNCCVLKLSVDAPATAAIIRTICAECFPPEKVAVVTGRRAENQALLDQPFDKIFFTGSTHVGREVLRRAAEHLTPVTLELGGKSPVLVDASADLALAARRIAFGKLLNAGQTCVAPDYVLVERSVQDAFVDALKKQFSQLCPDPLTNPQYVHIVNRKHFDRLNSLISSAQCVWGGESDPGTLRIAPTILQHVSAQDAVMQEEIFGPLLPILPVETLDEAIDFVKARPKPLACYLFSNRHDVQKKVMNTLSFGGGCINDTVIHLASSHLPFGGVGASGMGQYHGRESFRCFTHDKGILKKGNWLDIPLRYTPYTDKKARLIRFFMK